MPDPIVTPPILPAGVQSVMPVHARRGHFVPEVGGWLTVSLPGESVRSLVEEIFTRDIVTVRIKSIVARTSEHGVKQGDLVPVQRAVGQLDTEIWQPVDQRAQQEREAREAAERAAAAVRMAPEPAEPEPEPEPEEEPVVIQTGTHDSAEANSLGLAESFKQSEPAPPNGRLDRWRAGRGQ